mgnify:CR=1 FL=1
MVKNKLLFCGALLGLASVIMGALGDHALDLNASESESLATAIRYNMIYAVLITVLSFLSEEHKFIRLPTIIFTVGTFLFSFSIYTAMVTNIGELTFLTPIGGVTLMIGWISLMSLSLSFHQNK